MSTRRSAYSRASLLGLAFALLATLAARAQQVGDDPATDPYRRWAITIWG